MPETPAAPSLEERLEACHRDLLAILTAQQDRGAVNWDIEEAERDTRKALMHVRRYVAGVVL